MKKLWLIFLLVFIFCGCKSEKELETVSDGTYVPETVIPMEICVSIPEDAAAEVMTSSENGSIYFCDDYTLTIHTVPAGDLRKTMLDISGFTPDQLPLIKTQKDNCISYDFAWSTVGEQGDQVCRCTVLDDGNFHYILTVMADAEHSGRLAQEQWEDIFGSFCLEEQEPNQY